MPMNVFIQGMRRSGTTFLFDILSADGRFDGYYEPLAKAKRRALGGGSGVSKEDFFHKIRETRNAFASFYNLPNTDILNYGAPRCPELELKWTFSFPCPWHP